MTGSVSTSRIPAITMLTSVIACQSKLASETRKYTFLSLDGFADLLEILVVLTLNVNNFPKLSFLLECSHQTMPSVVDPHSILPSSLLTGLLFAFSFVGLQRRRMEVKVTS